MDNAQPVSTEAKDIAKTIEVVKPADPTTPEVKPDDKKEPLSPRFAALAKNEKRLSVEREKLKAHEATLQTKEKQIQEFEALKKNLTANPLKALEYLGISYKELTDHILRDGRPTPEIEAKNVVTSEIEKFKKEQEEARKKDAEDMQKKQQAQYDETLAAFKRDMTSFYDSKKTEYEYLSYYESVRLIDPVEKAYEVIEAHHQSTKKVLSPKEAFDAIEAYLKDKESDHPGLKRVKPPASGDKDAKQNLQQPKVTTLTNNMASNAPNTLPAHTEQDRIKRALAALNK